jgi:hypothetical protein
MKAMPANRERRGNRTAGTLAFYVPLLYSLARKLTSINHSRPVSPLLPAATSLLFGLFFPVLTLHLVHSMGTPHASGDNEQPPAVRYSLEFWCGKRASI